MQVDRVVAERVSLYRIHTSIILKGVLKSAPFFVKEYKLSKNQRANFIG